MKKKVLIITIIVAFVLSAFVLVACDKKGDGGSKGAKSISFYADDNLVTKVETNGNESITLPTAPEKSGYYFVGWFDGDNEFSGNEYKNKSLSSDVNVYAKYKKYIHVKYVMNGGKYVGTDVPGELPDGDLPDEYLKEGEELDYGYTVIEKDNCIFAGWYDNAAFSGNSIKMPYKPTSDMTLYANWAEKNVRLENGIGLTYQYSYEGTIPDGYYINSYNGNGGEIDIPADYKGLPIIEIGGDVFKNKKITSVTTHDNLLKINYNAFYLNGDLTKIVIADTVKEIGENAFYACRKLSDITFGSGIKKLGNGAFGGTQWYYDQPVGAIYVGKVFYYYKGNVPAEVTIKDGTVSIADNAFDANSRKNDLTSVIIPDSVKYIGVRAFRGCTSLKEIELPKNLEEIGNMAFDGSGLTSIVVPDSVKVLGTAFKNCKSLKTITIGSGVTSFEYDTFSDCAVETLIIRSNTAFGIYGLPDSIKKIYVPAGALEGFKEKSPDYADIIFSVA